MSTGTNRWIEVTPSPFPHEQEGLQQIKELLPGVAPFRAWSNVEFRDGQGKWHEVDLLVLGRRRLHLVELKYYAGTLRGDDLTWRREGKPPEDSPLKLARRKAQRLASRLKDELFLRAREQGLPREDPREVLPFVQESVYLHHKSFRSALPLASERDLFAPPDRQRSTNLPSIADRLLEPGESGSTVDARIERTVVDLLGRIGLVPRRQREIGSWIIDDEPLADGEGYQDWLASHRVVPTDRARIRFLVQRPGSPPEEAVRLRQAAEHEYRITSRLQHDGLLRPRDLVDDPVGVGLVYPTDDRYRRLDLWLAEHPEGLPVQTQLSLVRQVAEAVSYAHRHRVVHRGLGPSAVQVRDLPDGGVRTLVADWQRVGLLAGTPSSPPPTGLTGLPDTAAQRLGALLGLVDEDAVRAEAYQAPEGVRAPDRVRLDVFGLGALAYLVLARRPPALTRAALRDRLGRDQGLDLAADLPQVPRALRELVLRATAPKVSERLADVPEFLERLARAEQEAAPPQDVVVDPLDASPGAVLAGRFTLLRQLGKGSTAYGLLVTDGDAGGVERVLKVAVDDAAAQRLDDEAAALTGLEHPRLVRLLEGPLTLGTRRALLLTSAGSRTLGDELHTRPRLSLDLLDRWGSDLLEAALALDAAGLTHRDIKPANLGVLTSSRGQKHLVLFDFSLARAAATSLTAGTPPYLDPFLEDPERTVYDSAAERYAVAVVLFEMATGRPPEFGDGATDPYLSGCEATVEAGQFDPAVGAGLVPFFRRALARSARARFDTVGDMHAAWCAVFDAVPDTAHDDPDAVAAAAGPRTPLAEAGLSARAISAVEPFAVATAGDLAALDPMRLNAFSGVAEATRREVKERAAQWRAAFSAGATEPDPVTATADWIGRLVTVAPNTSRPLVRLVLGHEGQLDAFAPMAAVASAAGVKRNKVTGRWDAARAAWRGDADVRIGLASVQETVRAALAGLGGAARTAELVAAVAETLPSGDPSRERTAAGLLALALDVPDEGEPLTRRRAGDQLVLIATDAALLDLVQDAAVRADRLVATGQVLAPSAAASELRGAAGLNSLSDGRLVTLAAALSKAASVSGRGELHSRALPEAVALGLALSGLSPSVQVTAAEVRTRFRARFPALPPLPDRPRLDAVVSDAGTALVYDAAAGAYRAHTASSETTGLESRQHTNVVRATSTDAGVLGEVGVRLRASLLSRSFLALGVDARFLDRAARLLRERHGAGVLDVTGVLVSAMRTTSAQFGLAWEQVLAADRAQQGSREQQGLATLVERALPAVDAAVEAALADGPVVLTDLGALAQYGHVGRLARLTDLTAPRAAAVWALLPQLAGQQGANVDGRPLPLAAPGQFLLLDAAWLTEVVTTPA